MTIDPKLDLVLERTIDVPRELVWAAWTQPEHLSQWFTPAPWTVSECGIDLRPGGIFRTVMRSPEGREFPNRLLPGNRTERAPGLDRCFAAWLPPFGEPVHDGDHPAGIARRGDTLYRHCQAPRWASPKAGARPSISLLHM